jgi:TolA-binding protein
VPNDSVPSIPRQYSNAEVHGDSVLQGNLSGYGYRTGLRQDIASAIEQHERSSEKVAVSEGPLPRTWKEAVPYVVWGVLVLGFGLELVAAFVRGEWTHAIVSFAGLVALMSAALHWQQIKSWATGLNPNWVVASLSLVLAGLILSPFVEERRWPFSTAFHDPPTADDLARATAPLRSEVVELQRQLQAARQTSNALPTVAGIVTAQELRQRIENLEKQLDTTKRENDEAQRQLGIARQTTSAPQAQGAINWNTDGQFVVVTGGGPDALINSVLIQGTSTTSVAIKEAYAVSGLTGHKQDLVANVQYRGYYPVDKVDIPPQAPVWLELLWKPPLSVKDFLDQWGQFHVTIVYDGITYEHKFDENYIRKKLQQQIPGAFGPRVTPRDGK